MAAAALRDSEKAGEGAETIGLAGFDTLVELELVKPEEAKYDWLPQSV